MCPFDSATGLFVGDFELEDWESEDFELDDFELEDCEHVTSESKLGLDVL